jgi:thiol-disulfide isomerase/thioredoxin
MRKTILILFLFFLPFSGQAATQPWTTQDAQGQTEVHLYLFWSLTCPHCLTARPQILELASQHDWIRLHDHELSENPANVERFIELAKSLGEEAQAVPTLIYCGQMEVGWEDRPAAANEFLSRLESCRQHGVNGATPPLATPHLSLPLIGEIDAAKLSLPLLTILLAGLDAFNPCAFFVLLFLLSLLVHQQSRQRMLIIGGVFVAFSGLMYFAFMAAWLNLFLLIGSLPWVTAAAGLVALLMAAVNLKDYLFFHQGITLSIPEGGKADIFQRARRILNAGNLPAMLATTILLAIAANFYELLCTAGFPMVFTRLLTLQESSTTQHYLYLALYNVIYVLPLLLIVLSFVRSMGARKLSEHEGRLLKLLSGLMMLGLGLLLLLAPEKLGNVGLALAIPGLAIGLTWAAARWTRQ